MGFEARDERIDMKFDPETNEMVDLKTGERIPVFFDLRERYDAEVDVLLDALLDKCRELKMPVVVGITTSNGRAGNKCVVSGCLPGRRAPGRMYAALAALQGDKEAGVRSLLESLLKN